MNLARAFIFVAVGAVLSQSASAQYSAVRLHPTSASSSLANAVSGGVAVGQLDGVAALSNSGGPMQPLTGGEVANGIHDGVIVGTAGTTAMFWAGETAVGQELPMGDFFEAAGYGVFGGDFVGSAITESFTREPVLWPAGGTPQSLAPGMFGAAYSIDAANIAGVAGGRAQVWDRATLLPTDLHDDSLWMSSEALDVDGNDVVGNGLDYNGEYHATLWSGPTYASVNLHPAGYIYSFARATANGVQVGYGHQASDFLERALLWTGTAESVVNLHDFLPAGEYVASFANGIDAEGNIVGAARTASGETHAYLWKKAGYTVGPFQCPINDPASPISEFKKNSLVVLRTQVRDANGQIAWNLDVQASVKRLSDGTMLSPNQFSLTNSSQMLFIPFINEYWLILDMGWSKGLYEIGATVNPSGETHSVVVRIK